MKQKTKSKFEQLHPRNISNRTKAAIGAVGIAGGAVFAGPAVIDHGLRAFDVREEPDRPEQVESLMRAYEGLAVNDGGPFRSQALKLGEKIKTGKELEAAETVQFAMSGISTIVSPLAHNKVITDALEADASTPLNTIDGGVSQHLDTSFVVPESNKGYLVSVNKEKEEDKGEINTVTVNMHDADGKNEWTITAQYGIQFDRGRLHNIASLRFDQKGLGMRCGIEGDRWAHEKSIAEDGTMKDGFWEGPNNSMLNSSRYIFGPGNTQQGTAEEQAAALNEVSELLGTLNSDFRSVESLGGPQGIYANMPQQGS